MSAAIVTKTLRDIWWQLLLVCVFILGFEVFMMRMLIEAVHDLELLKVWLERPLIKTFVRLALGDDLAGDFSINALATVGLAHPLLYAASWALLLTMATGAIVGEIGRGTADLLLTLPVSRTRVYISTSLGWVLAALPISGVPIVGLWLGERIFPLDSPLDFSRLWPVAANLYALNLSIAAVTMGLSAFLSRRGPAIGIVLAGLLISDLLNLLAQFWDKAERLSVFGFLHYYRPLPIVRAGEVPWGDVAVLLGVGALAWGLGAWHFSRRDIPAA